MKQLALEYSLCYFSNIIRPNEHPAHTRVETGLKRDIDSRTILFVDLENFKAFINPLSGKF